MGNFAEKLQAKTNEFKANVEAAAVSTKEHIAQCVQVAKDKAEKSRIAVSEKLTSDRWWENCCRR
ncbi:hypothetical protein [Kosakonia oryziphila]|uniref:Uncharacterized protein n=1 Tax=Kosakonia oryziphila TaxID=1005667 RepID=A0A1C4GP34_9ENTR|nr:hypothetical protein [Kosakonia oryziphila]SCC69511.1 hypothetical protein GA0061070_10905 [Kosakonia oryziphila]